MQLGLFDFDGTLTTKDSLLDFISFSKGKLKLVLGLFVLSPILVAYRFKLVKGGNAKESALKLFFGGMEYNSFKDLGK